MLYKFLKITILFLLAVFFASCSNSDSPMELIFNSMDSVNLNKSPANDTIKVDFSQGSFFSKFRILLQPPMQEENFVERCTFDGSLPTIETDIFDSAKLLEKNTVVRCTKFWKNTIEGLSTIHFYFLGEKVKMPIVAISVDPDYFENYINAKPCKPNPCNEAKFWEDVEMPVYVEYFPDGSFSTQPAFSINAGIKISGGYSRNQNKKSVTIVMRKQYEKGRIEYPLFETRPENSRFKSFILRNNGNRYVSDYFIDAMGGALLEGSGVDYQRSRLVVVYYNGIYHGIYDMREKQNEHFIENNHGVNADDVNIIKHAHDKINEKSGSSKGYEKLLKFAAENDFSDTNSKPYIEIGKMMDLSNYADYMAAEIYFHNGDWPQNNVRAWSSTNQPWRFMVYDLDHGFDGTWAPSGFSQKINMVQWIMQGGVKMRICYDNANEKCFHTLFVKLIKNPDFKRMFLNHASVLYSKFVNNKNASNIINKMYSTLDLDEVVRDLEQFPRAKYTNSCGSGFSIDGSCVKQWTKDRDVSVWNDLKDGLNMGKPVQVEFESSKNGNVYIEDILLPASGMSGLFFEDNKILIKAETNSTHKFASWMDGSTENPRLIIPKQGLKIRALFQ